MFICFCLTPTHPLFYTHLNFKLFRDLWNDAGDPEGRGGRAPAPGSPTIPNVPPFESQDPPIPNTLSLSSPSVSPRDLSRLRLARANAHSLRSDFRLKLEVAKEHLHDPAIYFPHNMVRVSPFTFTPPTFINLGANTLLHAPPLCLPSTSLLYPIYRIFEVEFIPFRLI